MLPRHLVHWINSFSHTSCALVSVDGDLIDGKAIYEIATSLGMDMEFKRRKSLSAGAYSKHNSISTSGNDEVDEDEEGKEGDEEAFVSVANFGEVALTGLRRIRAVLVALATAAGGFHKLPPSLQSADSAKRVVLSISSKQEPGTTKPLVDLLDCLHVMQAADKENEGVGEGSSRRSAPLKISNSVREKQAALRVAATIPSPNNLAQIQQTSEATAPSNSGSGTSKQRIDRDAGRDDIRASFPLRKVYRSASTATSIPANVTKPAPRSKVSTKVTTESSGCGTGYRAPGVNDNAWVSSALDAEIPGKSKSIPSADSTVRRSADVIQNVTSTLDSHKAMNKSLQTLYDTHFPVPPKAERIRIHDWLLNLGVNVSSSAIENELGLVGNAAESLKTRNPFDIHASDHAIFSEEMCNGIVLSELAAVLVRVSGQSRLLVKSVAAFNELGRSMRPRLLIEGTETNVTRRVQAIRNIQIALSAMRDNCEPSHALRDMTPSPQAVFDGKVSVWAIISIVYHRFGKWLLNASVSGQTVRNRAGSASPRARAGSDPRHKSVYMNMTIDSINLPEPSSEPEMRSRGQSKSSRVSRSMSPMQRCLTPKDMTRNNVRFSASTQLNQSLDKKIEKSASIASVADSLNTLKAAVARGNKAPAWDDSISDLARFRTAFPEDRGLGEAQKEEPSEVDDVKRKEAGKERLAARLYMLKARNHTFHAKYREKKREQLEQYAKDVVSGGDDVSSQKERNHTGVQDAPNTATSAKLVKRKAYLSEIERAARYAQLGLSKLRVLQQESVMWVAPMGDPAKNAALRKVALPRITARQMVTVREWFLSLGLSILDGEGGFFYWDAGKGMAVHTYTAPPLSLGLDRLRNGQLLCALLHVLEPAASDHAHLGRLMHKSMGSNGNFASVVKGCDSADSKNSVSSISVNHSIENVNRALWLLKLRRCPPIPEHFLVRAEEIVRGDKDALWGLLWEILQAYPYSNDYAAASSGTFNRQDPTSVHANDILPSSQETQNDVSGGVGFRKGGSDLPAAMADLSSFPSLQYTPAERRQLDQSLVKYVYSLNLIKWNGDGSADSVVRNSSETITHHTIGIPKSLSALETCIRDGTLFCALGEKVLGLGSVTTSRTGSFVMNAEGHGFEPFSWNTCPHTYQQCLSNIIKVVVGLRNMATGLNSIYNMGSRFLYTGCEEAIIRGDWDTILGLLEDMRRCAEKVPQRPLKPAASHPAERPYYGPDGAYGNVDAQDVAGNNIHRVQGMYEQAAPYLHHRQYETKSVRVADSTDIRADMMPSDESKKSGISGYTKMNAPAKLSLHPNQLAWRGEEVHGRNNDHNVDLVPHPHSPDDASMDGNHTVDSIDAAQGRYDRDSHGRTVKNPHTGVDIATDFVEADVQDPSVYDLHTTADNAEAAKMAANIYPNDNERQATAAKNRSALAVDVPKKGADNEGWTFQQINNQVAKTDFSSSNRLVQKSPPRSPCSRSRSPLGRSPGREINRDFSNVTRRGASPLARDNLQLSPSRGSPSSPRNRRYAQVNRSLSPPSRGTSDAVLHKSFHLSPTPLTPAPMTTIKKAAGGGQGKPGYGSHVYSTRGADYDEVESNISDSPGDPEARREPEMVDLISSDPRTRAAFVRNTEAYVTGTTSYDNEYNYTSKINRDSAASSTPTRRSVGTTHLDQTVDSSTKYLAMPSSNFQYKDSIRNPVTGEKVSGKSAEFTVKSSFDTSFISTKTNPRTIMSGRTAEASAAKTMILSNTNLSIRSKVSDIVDRSRLEKAHSIVQWLQSIGVLAEDIRMLRAGSHDLFHPSAAEILSTFSDGVALCRTIETLTYASTIPGSVSDPKSPAHKLQNIRRALERIKKCTTAIPPSQLMCAEEICEGKVDVILTLLVRLRKAYKGFYKKPKNK